jgi:hypothetical protein
LPTVFPRYTAPARARVVLNLSLPKWPMSRTAQGPVAHLGLNRHDSSQLWLLGMPRRSEAAWTILTPTVHRPSRRPADTGGREVATTRTEDRAERLPPRTAATRNWYAVAGAHFRRRRGAPAGAAGAAESVTGASATESVTGAGVTESVTRAGAAGSETGAGTAGSLTAGSAVRCGSGGGAGPRGSTAVTPPSDTSGSSPSRPSSGIHAGQPDRCTSLRHYRRCCHDALLRPTNLHGTTAPAPGHMSGKSRQLPPRRPSARRGRHWRLTADNKMAPP